MSLKELVKGQKGQALIAALIVLVVGSVLLTPLLGLMGTGTKSGQVIDRKVHETYAADAGVEDAMWHIRNNNPDDDNLLREVLGTGYNPYDYSTTYPYLYNLDVNDKHVAVNISNIWIPSSINIDGKTPSQLNQTISNEKLIIVGYPGSTPSTYVIKIVCDWKTNTTIRDNLKVKTLGVWLCAGFEYDGLIDGNQLPSGSPSPSTNLHKGGTAVVWNFTSQPLLKSFPPSCTTSCPAPMVKTITFRYKGPEGQIPELVASWIDTTGVNGITYTWDDSIRLYKIVSQAGTVEVESYGAKTRFRKLKTTISGDYYATGNSLITGMEDPYNNIHYVLHKYSSQTISTNDVDDTLGIPSDATVEAAYLYWTGWIDWRSRQTRYPSGDISNSGTWDKTTSMYSYVNEVGVANNDTTYLLLSSSGGGSALFSFPAFNVSLPAGETITGLTVSLVARDNSSGTNNMRPAIIVNGTYYYGTSTNVPTSYDTISYEWSTNPRTGNAWTQDQINGIGSNALQGFGVYSTDASPSIRLTQVCADVAWTSSTLKYPANPTEEALQVLVEDTARVNKVNFHVGSNPDTIVTADKWETLSPAMLSGIGAEGTWYYTCKADVTSLVKGWISNGAISSNGAGTYTVGHVSATNAADPSCSFIFYSGGGSTGCPLGTPAPQQSDPVTRYYLAHAGWSLLILYSSANVLNHQYYLYDIGTPGFSFFFGGSNDPDFDNDGSAGGTISGFIVPPQIPGETNAARITVMVGEGDKADGSSGNSYCQDRFKVKDTPLPDGTGLPDVWNGNSRGLPTDCGIDIDQFYVTWASGILKPMDVSAKINMPTTGDYWTCSYMLFQFRSLLGVGGVITNYAIRLG